MKNETTSHVDDNSQKYDLIVIGAGAAGMSAAIAAGRRNVKVLLIEKYGYLGGTATMGLVHHWDPVILMESKGIIMEVYELLKKEKALIDFDKSQTEMPFAYWEGGCGFDPEVYKTVWMRLLKNASVDVLYHTTLIGSKVYNRQITQVQIVNKSGISWIAAKIFIDGSGDGDLLASSGCEFSVGDEHGICFSPTLAFRIGGVDTEEIYRYFDNHPDQFGNHPRLGKYIKNHRQSATLQGFYDLIEQA